MRRMLYQSARIHPHSAIGLVRRERLELSVRRLRGDCFTRLAYGARDELRSRCRLMKLAELTRFELAASR
jgi:hypothetical protein